MINEVPEYLTMQPNNELEVNQSVKIDRGVVYVEVKDGETFLQAMRRTFIENGGVIMHMGKPLKE